MYCTCTRTVCVQRMYNVANQLASQHMYLRRYILCRDKRCTYYSTSYYESTKVLPEVHWFYTYCTRSVLVTDSSLVRMYFRKYCRRYRQYFRMYFRRQLATFEGNYYQGSSYLFYLRRRQIDTVLRRQISYLRKLYESTFVLFTGYEASSLASQIATFEGSYNVVVRKYFRTFVRKYFRTSVQRSSGYFRKQHQCTCTVPSKIILPEEQYLSIIQYEGRYSSNNPGYLLYRCTAVHVRSYVYNAFIVLSYFRRCLRTRVQQLYSTLKDDDLKLQSIQYELSSTHIPDFRTNEPSQRRASESLVKMTIAVSSIPRSSNDRFVSTRMYFLSEFTQRFYLKRADKNCPTPPKNCTEDNVNRRFSTNLAV